MSGFFSLDSISYFIDINGSNGHNDVGSRAQIIAKDNHSAMLACFAQDACSPKTFAGCRNEFGRLLSCVRRHNAVLNMFMPAGAACLLQPSTCSSIAPTQTHLRRMSGARMTLPLPRYDWQAVALFGRVDSAGAVR